MPQNHEKITKELCWKKNLIFLPETAEEAHRIQKKLFSMGYIWADGKKEVFNIDLCLQRGIVLLNQALYTRGEKDNTDYLLCALSQFEKGDVPELTPAEQMSFMNEFSKLAARVEAIAAKVETISQKVDEMHDEVMPKVMNKSVLKIPGKK